jgi:CubicO group peptidase (beta-lactamase class C family)
MSRRLFLILGFILLTSAATAAQQGALPPDIAKKVDDLVVMQMEAQKIPGMTVAIAVDGEIRYSKAFGMADLENGVKVKTDTVFRTASIAKPMTATAVMQLAEAGRLDLDAPIQRYCPAFPEKPWAITARLLLSHQSGIRHYEKPNESNGTEHFFTIADSLKLFKDDPLKQEPGAKFTYSTFAYSVLGCAIEGASGIPYLQYMREKVWAPAGMTRTTEDNAFVLVPDRARGYLRLDQQTAAALPAASGSFARVGDVYNAPLHDTSMKVPGGGLLSTAEDLVRFIFAYQKGALVKPETRDLMWTKAKTRDGQETPYGLGWNVAVMPGGSNLKQVLHTGGQAGTSTVLSYWPEKNLVVAVMMNISSGPTTRAANAIAEIVLASRP